jgi:hypothetical protein
MYDTGAALAGITSDMSTRFGKYLANKFNKKHSRIDFGANGVAIQR